MIETSFKNSQNQNIKLFQKQGVLFLGHVLLLEIIRYVQLICDLMLCFIWMIDWEGGGG